MTQKHLPGLEPDPELRAAHARRVAACKRKEKRERAYTCRRCHISPPSVTWDAGEEVFICSGCGAVDANKTGEQVERDV